MTAEEKGREGADGGEGGEVKGGGCGSGSPPPPHARAGGDVDPGSGGLRGVMLPSPTRLLAVFCSPRDDLQWRWIPSKTRPWLCCGGRATIQALPSAVAFLSEPNVR